MALYLKYRPLDFSSLVGQEFIKFTLKAAVAQDKTVGAYIFTGPRGTGKTSTARIFAKAVNCQKTNTDSFNEDAFKYTSEYILKIEKKYFPNIGLLKLDEVLNDIKFKTSINEYTDNSKFFLASLGRYNTGHKEDKKHTFVDFFIEDKDSEFKKDIKIFLSTLRIGELNNHIHTGISRLDIRFLQLNDLEYPCNACNTCIGYNFGHLIDVIEIDAASHTGVDNIREIIEKAQFQPTQAKYKIYIIDEVHMLSKGAFNALLKILEEPPVHVKFILATTEIHKVPDTILSRCQRYDFKNFSDSEIKGRLEYIAGQEKISVDDESYGYIVKNAEGGMRNAVSLFEQLIADGKISYSHIVETLGVASEDEKNSFIEKLIQKDVSLMDDFHLLQNSGKNLKNFFKEILHDIQGRAIEILKNGKDISSMVHLMESLQDMLMKSKNSFDENMTLSIGLLKILGGGTVVSGPNPSDLRPASFEKGSPVEKKGVMKKEIPAKKIEISEDIVAGAQDIFASSEIALPTENIKTSSGSGVDINVLKAACKKHGGKAALSMTLNGAIFDMVGDILSIDTKTKIALATLQKTENREILMLALEDMGTPVSDIKVS